VLVCLLPVRNGEADLPGYFESVARFADSVVALDDGSTDGTRELLESHPLVEILLTNPPREDYEGWNDSANRTRLLAAAGEKLAPDWILSLDADERIDAADAGALREFLANEAVRGDAYLLQVLQMIGDLHHYEPGVTWVGRLFAYEPGQEFPAEPLHFVALPTSIPRSRWRETTIRVQHLANLTPERRAIRYEKYQQVDRERQFQASYDRVLEPPRSVEEWRPRSPALPVLKNAPRFVPEPPPGPDPLVSAIVISQNDEAVIERAVDAVLSQNCAATYEVILVTSGTDRTAEIVRARFPEVRVVELDHAALPGEARNAGLEVARGVYTMFPGSHVELLPGAFAARLRAFRRGYAMVAPTLLNGTTTFSGWASYFLDNGPTLPGRPSQQLDEAPQCCSYVRTALLDVGGFPEDLRAGEDTVVNGELFRRGYSAYRERDNMSIHHSPCRTPWKLVRHHFARGRSMGRIMLVEAEQEGRIPTPRMVRFVTRQVPNRLRRLTRQVHEWGNGLRARYWLVFPLVLVGATSWWLGGCYELLRSGPGVRRRLRRSAHR
jgi:glycosyltransferase involved in cell wall biosynthesis